MSKETNRTFGFKVKVKCFHPEEQESYECNVIEEDIEDYQGFRCPKCGHEIGLILEQYYFDKEKQEGVS